MNLLKLPNYGTKALLHKKLIAAIEAGAGFELSVSRSEESLTYEIFEFGLYYWRRNLEHK
jgi:hypothetical protein